MAIRVNPQPVQTSESAFLESEAQFATAEMQRLKKELLENLKLAAKPEPWVRKYPWPAVGTAVIGGLTAAVVVKPLVFGRKPAVEPEAQGTAKTEKVAKASAMASLFSPLVGLGITALKNIVLSALTAQRSEAAYTQSYAPEGQEMPIPPH